MLSNSETAEEDDYISKEVISSFRDVLLAYMDWAAASSFKGWKFYLSSSKHFVISKRANFDECYFPGLKMSSMSASPPNYTSAAAPQIVQRPDL